MTQLPTDITERIRAICLALPEATEKEAWGMPTFRVGGKMFAMFANDHHGDGRVALWCNADPEQQRIRVAADPDRFFVPPYMGPRGWVGVLVERVSDETLAECVEDAYCRVAPRRLLLRRAEA